MYQTETKWLLILRHTFQTQQEMEKLVPNSELDKSQYIILPH